MRLREFRLVPHDVKAGITRLVVFDFDQTLFWSPLPPEGLTNVADWWRSARSLSPPNVPEEPGEKHWNKSVVAAAKKSLADSKAYTVLLTGRKDAYTDLKRRVHDLIKQAGLRFDRVFLNPTTGPNAQWKADAVTELLNTLPDVTEVEVWDDDSANIDAIGKAAEAHKVRFIPRLVAPPRESILWLTSRLRHMIEQQ